MGWAYVADQVTPLLISLLVLFFVVRKKNFKNILSKLRPFYWLLILLFILAAVTHLGILYYYFWSDEPLFVLEPVTQNQGFHFHSLGGANLRGYFLSFYIFTYLLAGTNNLVYQILNLTFFSISVLFVFWFLYLLTNNKTIATLAAAFFATTPAYLDMFTWQNSNYAPILILGLTSLIMLLHYKKTKKFIYYLLSLMFFFVSVKMGFVRVAGFAFIPLLLFFAPIYKTGWKFSKLISLSLPYLAISIYFVLFEFISGELQIALAPFAEGIGFSDALHLSLSNVTRFLSKYREFDQNSSLFLPKLWFFSAYLFFPGGLAGEILLRLRPIFQHISLALSVGKITVLILSSLFLYGLRFRKTREGWLVMFAILFIFLNMLHFITGYQASPEDFSPAFPGSSYKLDSRFALENSGYGPGSRYLFISSLGAGLLFALVISRLVKKGGKRALVAVLFCFAVIAGNIYFTTRSQVQNFEGMKGYKSLVENIFKIVPRDGKPKLLISANPESNGLDRKFGGSGWIYGFYKKQELVYAANLQEANELFKNGQYLKENIYAFSNNPHTHTFADISQEARDYFYANPALPNSSTLEFGRQKQTTIQLDSGTDGIYSLQRAIIESAEVKKRYIAPKKLNFRLTIRRLENPPLPISDSFFTDQPTQYKHLFPLQLWSWISLPPEINPNLRALKQESESRRKKTQFRLLDILQERQALKEHTRIDVSNMQDLPLITKESLVDGFYTTYPYPNTEPEVHYIAGENPATIALSFTAIKAVRRILFNTPYNYSTSSLPKNITVLASSDNRRFHEVVIRENLIPDKWSPNRGAMTRIDLPQTVNALSLKFVITGNLQPVALDEIVVDGPRAAVHSPENIYNTARSVYHYIDNKDYLKELTQIKGSNRLALFWACAEDADWEKQLKVKEDLVLGIWHAAEVDIPPESNLAEDSATINCYGSSLRKIFFVSPPYPVEMEIIKAVLE